MDYSSIGKSIRKVRLEKGLTQAELAEKSDITANYLGLIERREKMLALETLINIINVLGVSADIILCDLIKKDVLLTDKLDNLSQHDKNTIYDVVDTLIKHARNRY